MGSPYTNTKRKRVKTSKITKAQKLTPLIGYAVAACFVLAAIYTVVSSTHQSDASAVDDGQQPYSRISKLTDHAAFKEAYLSVNCSGELQQTIQTLRASGQVDSGSTSQAFLMIKKRPDRMLFTVDFDTHDMTIGVTGNTVWQRIRAPQRGDELALLEGEDAAVWLGQRSFFDPLTQALQSQGAIQKIETSEWEGESCLKVQIKPETAEDLVEMLVNPRTMHLVAQFTAASDGKIQKKTYRDYRKIKGMPVPFTTETYVGEKLIRRLTLNSASINTGVLSGVFEIPQSLRSR